MSNEFDGPSWIAGGRRMDEIREMWESETFSAAWSEPVTGDDGCLVDATVSMQTSGLKLSWYDLIGNVGVSLGSDSSKMAATGENYSATEEQAVQANDRFWGRP